MATRSIRRRDKPAYGGCATERDDLIGISFAELIKASGRVSRINRPDTCVHPTKPSNTPKTACQYGAVHTCTSNQ